MAIRVSNNIKNELLDAGFIETAQYAIVIEAWNSGTGQAVSSTHEFITFKNASAGIKENTAPVDIDILGNKIVNQLRLFYYDVVGNTKGVTAITTINLSGGEIGDFSSSASGGIYRVNELKITM